MKSKPQPLILFSGRGNPELSEKVAQQLDLKLGELELSNFANGEIYARPAESVRGGNCFVLQSHCHPVNDRIMEQLIIIDALRRASARRITAVMPFYGYARQDKKVLPREPISARLMGDMFMTAGADRLVSVDLHTGQLQGFISKPFDHLTALPIITDYLQPAVNGPTTLVVSPDAGGVKRAEKYATRLKAEGVAVIYKRRDPHIHNLVDALEVTGSVLGKDVIIVDDVIDTAGTICSAAELLKNQGAHSVRVAATHAVLSGPALDRLGSAPIDETIVTDTLPVPTDALSLSNFRVLSIAPVVAEALQAIYGERSVSDIFLGDNL